jgi:hypothetical protein
VLDYKEPDFDAWKKRFPPLHWLTGTIDYWNGDDWLDDLKTGHWVTPPKDNKQLRSYCLLPWLLSGKPKRGVLATITQWERYPLGALPKRTGARIPYLDLITHYDDLRWAAENTDVVNPGPFIEGEMKSQCTFCPSRVMAGPFEWTAPWKMNISCWGGLAAMTNNVTE